MNPKAINSTNIIQFGFLVNFLLEENKIRFDIAGLTLFNAGGAAAVAGISFEVIDPSGVPLAKVGFTPPHIDPDVATTYELDMPSGISKFGYYKIKGVIKEANGTEYTIELPQKQVCEPTNWDEELMGVAGNFNIKVDCKTPNIRVSEDTPFAYQGLSPYSKVKAGMLYYPQGTLNPIAFTFTPFDSQTVYTGTYTIRNKTTVKFDLKDNVYVSIAYKTTLEKKVTCQSSIVDILCCLEKNQEEMDMYCNSSRGAVARKKHEQASVYLISAMAKETAGQDASEDIDKIREVLDCDCNCGPKLIEPKLAGPSTSNYTFLGECAIPNPTTAVVGGTTQVKYKAKYVKVIKSDDLDLGLVITKTEDDCNIIYSLALNYSVIANTILTSISNSQTLINQLMQIINVSGGAGGGDVDLTGLDGKCVINLTQTNYSVTVPGTVTSNKRVKSITINGIVHNAPADMLWSDVAEIDFWLNSLALGVFTVQYQAGPTPGSMALVIASINNPNKVATLLITNDDTATDETYQFSAANSTVKSILQAIINYLCPVKATQIVMGAEVNVCTIVSGAKKTQGFGINAYLSTVVAAIANSLCNTIDLVIAEMRLTCEKIKAIFPPRAGTFKSGRDFILGTKDGACSSLSDTEVAQAILNIITNDPALHQQFCRMIGQCNTGENPDIVDIVGIIGTVGLANINLTAINWSSVPPANQVISIWYRPCPTPGSTPPYVLVDANVTVDPAGTFLAALNIAPISSNSCYEILAKNNAGGIGTTRVFNTLAPAASNMIKINNSISGSTLTNVELNNVELLGGVPIASGAGSAYDIGALAGVSYTVEMQTSSAGAGQEMYFEHLRNGAIIASGYFTYTGAMTLVGNFILQAGDELTFMRATRHVQANQYFGSGGSISGVCMLTGITITRTAGAIADATHAVKTVQVTIDVQADNGCGGLQNVVFAPADAAQAFNIDLDCSGTPCTSITSFTIISVIEL